MLVLGLELKRLADGEASLVIVLLYEAASSEVVVSLIIVGVQFQ
jgi:hypothetical protein